MPIVDMRDMLDYANKHQFAIAAIDVTDLSLLEDVIRSATESQSPVIFTFQLRMQQRCWGRPKGTEFFSREP